MIFAQSTVAMLSCIILLCWTTSALTTMGSQTSSSRRVYWEGLPASGFRHPLDNELSSLVESSPLFGLATTGIRKFLSVAEESLRLQLLSSSVKVSENQLPELHDLLLEASEILAMQPPELYIQSSSVANAYTLASISNQTSADGDVSNATKPIVVVTSSLLDQCTMPEVQAILGHELGHLKCEHSVYLTLGSFISSLPSSMRSRLKTKLGQEWRLAAEYSCDRAAMLVAQDVDVVNGAMLKLYAGTSDKLDLNVEAFASQAEEYTKKLETANPFVKKSIEGERRSHPLPVRRVVELQKWSTSSTQYARLRNRAEQLEQFLEG